jgi:hypothetical protein
VLNHAAGRVLLLQSVARSFAVNYSEVTTHKVADGVYLLTTTPYADAGFCGNGAAVITSEGL